MISDRDAILAKILAEPEEDHHRLVFADCIEEQGEPVRAQFIRAQIEQQRIQESESNPDRRHELVKIETELQEKNWLRWLPDVAEGKRAVCSPSDKEPFPYYGGIRYLFSRGFVSHAIMSADDWMSYADDLAKHPITKITLSSWPRFEEKTPGVCGPLRLKGRSKWYEFEEIAQTGSLVEILLTLEWPKISFQFTPGVTDNMRQLEVLRSRSQIERHIQGDRSPLFGDSRRLLDRLRASCVGMGAERFAEEYHRITEAYDRRICTGPIGRDGMLPANNDERRAIESHARAVFEEIFAISAACHVSRDELRRAISEYRNNRVE